MLTALLAVALGAYSTFRAITEKGRSWEWWMAAAMFLLAIHLFTKWGIFLMGTVFCLGLYWLSIVRSKSRPRPSSILIRESSESELPATSVERRLQEILSLNDEEMGKIQRRIEEEAPTNKARERERERMLQEKLRRLHSFAAAESPLPVHFELSLENELRCPVDQGTLQIGPGIVKLAVRIRKTNVPGEEIHLLEITNSLVDNMGREWSTTSVTLVRNWLDKLDDPEFHFTLWDDAPEPWKHAMRVHCQVAAADELLDSRESRQIQVGSRSYEYYEKYQGPVIDIAWLPDEKRWLLRVSKLFNPDLSDEMGSDDGEEYDESWDQIPPFAWTVPADNAAVFSHPQWFALTVEELYEEEEGRSLGFKLTGTDFPPQPGVSLQADAPLDVQP